MDMKPTYSFTEVVKLILSADCGEGLEVLNWILTEEKKRYPLSDLHVFVKLIKLQSIRINK